MKRKIFTVIIFICLLCGCSGEQTEIYESVTLCEQTVQQLGVEIKEVYMPVEYDIQKALWFTMEDFRKALENRNEEEFTAYIEKTYEKIKNTGFNTVYVHVRPYNDSYYRSELFPAAAGLPADYDPFRIILDTAHGMGLSVHAWINPLRCQTDGHIQALDDSYIIKKWYNDEEKKNNYICLVGDRWYLNPAIEEVRRYIGDGVSEILDNYDADGIHIDDYFYPTQDADFDSVAFEQSGADELDDWRRNNIDLMVKEIYGRVKAKDGRLLFGISPQGNIDIDCSTLYADVEKWCSEEGWCDYIVPQLYYGFKNEAMPFEETFYKWKEMASAVTLYAGVCTYKIGRTDKWAGSGSEEWIEDRNIPSREIELVRAEGTGAAVYSMETLFAEENADELEKISAALKK